MGPSGISPASVVAGQMAQNQEAFAIKVMRKSLDIQAAQGQMLAQLVGRGAGLGNNLDMTA